MKESGRTRGTVQKDLTNDRKSSKTEQQKTSKYLDCCTQKNIYLFSQKIKQDRAIKNFKISRLLYT